MRHDATPLEAFGLACQYLGWVFCTPPKDEDLVLGTLQSLVAGWPLPEAGATQRGLTLLGDCLARWDAGTPKELEVDFNRLFVGPGRLLAPPWESVYRGVDRMLFDHHTLAVRRAYACFGLQASRRGGEPDDHLGLEFLFLGHLCEQGHQAEKAGDSDRAGTFEVAREQFLADHMSHWIPACLDLVRQHACTAYYQGQAHLAAGCLTLAERDL